MAVPQNEIIRSQTDKYLAGLDPANPPSPSEIEASVIDLVNGVLLAENVLRDPTAKSALLRKLTFAQIASIMLRLHHIVRIAPSGKNTDRDYDLLAMYNPKEGIYVTSDDDFRTVARTYNYELTTNEFKEIIAALKDSAPRAERCNDRDLIAVDNGIFNYATKHLQPFDHNKVFLSKASVAYNPNATSPVITHADGSVWEVEDWMHSLSDDPEIVELLWEVLGAIIRPHVRWNKSAWFYSERGNNGKGTLVELMRNLCGPNAYASIPIADFGKDFLLEPLTRASAILVDENDVGTFIDRAANLKAIITNDVISINRKFKTPIAYQFWGFMVQCLNEFPRIKDKSESFYRRQLFVPFTKTFTGMERKYIKNDYLHRTEVLEYVLKRVLNMNYYSLSEPASTALVLAEYKEFNDPVRAFWEEFRTELAWDLVPFTYLYALYQAWFKQNAPSGSPVGRNIFIKDITNIIDMDTLWTTTPNRDKAKPSNRMSAPEPLTHTYDLKDWYSASYSGKDVNQRTTLVHTQLSASGYRGALRITHATLPPHVLNAIGNPAVNPVSPDSDES